MKNVRFICGNPNCRHEFILENIPDEDIGPISPEMSEIKIPVHCPICLTENLVLSAVFEGKIIRENECVVVDTFHFDRNVPNEAPLLTDMQLRQLDRI